MKAGEVLRLLRISRTTLFRWAKDGILKRTKLPSGAYDWDEDSVYQILNKDVKRKNYIYARVSTYKQKNDLDNQIEMLKSWMFNSGLKLDGIYADVASGISFEKRKELFQLLDEILKHKVERVVIAYKDRLSRVGFELFSHLFGQFGTEIVVVSEIGNKKLDSEEVFEEIVSLLHCYSMKLYSKRRNKTIEVGFNDN